MYKKKDLVNEDLPLAHDLDVPIISHSIVRQNTLERIAQFGTVLLVHPTRYVQGKFHPEDLVFVSAIHVWPEKVADVRPISSDYKKIIDYFSWVKRVDVKHNNNGQMIFDMLIKLAVGPINIKIDNQLTRNWMNENIMLFENYGGDLDPLLGAWEFLPVIDDSHKQEQTMVVFTAANEIADSAGWLLKMMRNIPMNDLIIAMYMGMTLLEKQEPWVRTEIASKQTLVNGSVE